MSSDLPDNLLTEWSALLMESLADAGVADVVISPGSRNTPFVVAAARSARLRCHDVIDERAAGFFALGQARLSGRPSAVLCTSGTAGAHYLPAVLEAESSYTPMLVITADRPFELQSCAAPQTIDQLKLFGDHARAFFELGMPEAEPSALRAVRRVAAQAVHAATWPTPGAVQLNARARKPLEPRRAHGPAGERLAAEAARLRARPIARAAPPATRPDPGAVAEAAAAVRASRRGLVVCGPLGIDATGAHAAVDALASAAGYPLLCEAGSQGRFPPGGTGRAVVCDAFDTVFRSPRFRAAARPDLILQVGGTPTSSAWEQFLAAHPEAPRVVLHRHGWSDPQSASSLHILADPEASARALAEVVGPEHRPRGAWGELFAAANAAAWRSVHEALAAEGDALGEGAVARAVASAVPRGSLLALGNSLPIRLVDTFCEQGLAEARVLVQRGVNGIDGLVAGAAGSASVSTAPLTLLLGDVSLLHDLTSLALIPRAPVPCVVVAIQNRGGRIFEQLPIAGSAAAAELAHVTTPHELEFESAARMFGLGYTRVERTSELRRALLRAHGSGGAVLIEAVVPPSGAVQQHRRIWAACGAALESLAARAEEA